MIAIDLSGKTSLVTGASQGLGEAIARRLHAAGAAVAINYVGFSDNRERAERIVGELGERTAGFEGDVRDLKAVQGMAAAVHERFGGLDIVVNNAAIISDKTLRKMDPEQWCNVIDVNLTGVFNVCKAAAELLNDDGRIVNLASISGVVGFFGQTNYAAAKAGVIGLTKSLSKELARKGITVNAVAPGVVLTEMGKSIPEEVRAEMLKQIPLGRFAEPDEIADVVAFLCSPLASYLTGQVIHANGGWWG